MQSNIFQMVFQKSQRPQSIYYNYMYKKVWVVRSIYVNSYNCCCSVTPRVCTNSCPLSGQCHPTISSFATLFSSCPQSFPAWGSFPMNWLFTSGDQSIGASASASVLLMTIQDWFPLGLTGLISLLSKGL